VRQLPSLGPVSAPGSLALAVPPPGVVSDPSLWAGAFVTYHGRYRVVRELVSPTFEVAGLKFKVSEAHKAKYPELFLPRWVCYWQETPRPPTLAPDGTPRNA